MPVNKKANLKDWYISAAKNNTANLIFSNKSSRVLFWQ